MNNFIRMSLFHGLCLFLLMVAVAQPAPAQKKYLSTDELAAQADVIVSGKVNALKMEWNGDKSRIQTRVTISVDETMKGAVEGGTLTVLIPGGEVDGVGEWYSHSPRFTSEEEVVVFASKDKAGVLRVTAGEKGKFLVQKDARTGSKIIPNVGSLQDFKAQIGKTVKTQETIRKDG